MNTDKLSERLATVAGFVPKGYRLADIGSDHAYLPCYLVKQKMIPIAIAGEVVTGPYESARKQVQTEGFLEQISVRLGDGLEVIKPGEVDCITIAGMGGALITSILERGKEKLDSVKRLILQPNLSAVSIRKWLLENDWELITEKILEEDAKIYEVLVAEKGIPEKPYGNRMKAGLLLGPFLMQRKSEVFEKKWKQEMENWQRIFNQLEKASPTEETIQKKNDLQQAISLVKEVLNDENS